MSPCFFKLTLDLTTSRVLASSSQSDHQSVLVPEITNMKLHLRNPAVNAIFFERNLPKMGKVSRMKSRPLAPPLFDYLLISAEALPPSKLGLTELLELRLRLARCSDGSDGLSPLDLANRFKMSVNETTPDSLPEIFDPGSAPLGTGPGTGDWGVGVILGGGMMMVGVGEELVPVAAAEAAAGGGAVAAVTDGSLAWSRGVAGALGAGEAESTIHMRCELVATSFATVWARVE